MADTTDTGNVDNHSKDLIIEIPFDSWRRFIITHGMMYGALTTLSDKLNPSQRQMLKTLQNEIKNMINDHWNFKSVNR